MRPNVMDSGSMASSENSAVRRFAGARMAALGAAADWAGTATDARWRAGANKSAAFAERAVEYFMPRGYSLGSSAPRSQSRSDYRELGSQIGEGLKELGLFGGGRRGSGGSRFSGGTDFGAAFGGGFNADRATDLGWSMKGSIFD
jgi:hypothetical protein